MTSRDGKRLVYLFVTATFLDMFGEVIKFRDDREASGQPMR